MKRPITTMSLDTPLTEETSLELRKIWLQEKINQLSAELNAINNNTNE